jgi:hypothetical protein
MGAAVVWSARLIVQAIALFAVVRRTAPQLTCSPLSDRRLPSIGAPLILAKARPSSAVTS